MKISNEAKIGIFATLTIAIAIWGFKFLKSEGYVDRSLILYTKVGDARQINKSSPIYFRGIQVGTIKDFIFDPVHADSVTIVLKFNQNPNIPKNAKLILFANGALGGEAARIEFMRPCSGADCAQNEDYINGYAMSSLESMLGSPEDINKYVEKATSGVTSLFDTVSLRMKQPDNEVGNSLRDMQATLLNLRKTTDALSKLMVASSGSLNTSMQNVADITSNLKANNDKISSMLNNVNDVTGKATSIDFTKINKATEGVGQSIEELKKTLTETQSGLSQLTNTFKKLNEGQGTVGQFATNDSVYHSLNLSLVQTQALMQDIRLNPKRYINLNPFRKHKAYTLPSQDPLMEELQKKYNATQPKK